MISFTFFFLTHHFAIAAVGMIFFGLGEAFRSGTHKAMIYSYLERKGWFEHKTMVYGRTRSYSLLGSAVSALLAIVFVLAIPAVRWIFLITIVPYLFDFALILSYPDYLNEARQSRFSWRHFVQASRTQIKEIAGNGYLQKVLLSSALFDGTFKCIKDYIQPILKVLLLGSAIWTISGSTSENQLKIMLGIVYGIFYLVSSQASRHVHRIHQWFSSRRAMNISFDVFALILLVLSVCVQMQWISWVLLFFFALYLMKDARRPLFVDICGESMSKHQRATVLSVESQLRAVFMTALAPIFGWVAEELSVAIALAGTGFLLLAVNRLIHIPRQEAVN